MLEEKTAKEAYDKTRSIYGDKRLMSPTVHLRLYNNFIKSFLIENYCPKPNASILDLASGKGGDVPKWSLKKPSELTFCDISPVSMVECFNKYKSRLSKTATAKFVVGDTFSAVLKAILPEKEYHISSCQFALHYAFATEKMALQAIKNLTSQLLPGGYTIITTIDCFKMVDLFRKKEIEARNGTQEERRTIGNGLFHAMRYFEIENIPAFGAAYVFHLDKSVDSVMEYLIHPRVLDDLFSIFRMKRVLSYNFYDFYEMIIESDTQEANEAKYLYREMCKKLKGDFLNAAMTDTEWEICSLYRFYVYQKEGERVLPDKKPERGIEEKEPHYIYLNPETGQQEIVPFEIGGATRTRAITRSLKK